MLVVGLMVNASLPVPLAILAVVAVGAVHGLINGLIVTKVGVNSVIATLGTGTIVVGLNFAYSSGGADRVRRARQLFSTSRSAGLPGSRTTS